MGLCRSSQDLHGNRRSIPHGFPDLSKATSAYDFLELQVVKVDGTLQRSRRVGSHEQVGSLVLYILARVVGIK